MSVVIVVSISLTRVSSDQPVHVSWHGPYVTEIAPYASKIYVSNTAFGFGNTGSVIDGSMNTVVARVKVGTTLEILEIDLMSSGKFS